MNCNYSYHKHYVFYIFLITAIFLTAYTNYHWTKEVIEESSCKVEKTNDTDVQAD